MKTVIIYTSPKKEFDPESAKLIEVQKKLHPILLFTNFKYDGAITIPDIYCTDMTSVKIPVLIYLIERGMLNRDELYWYHDIDVYPNESFEPPNVDNFALAKYGYKDEWQCGSFFFRISALEDFKFLYQEMLKRVRTRLDEKTLRKLVIQGKINPQELDVSYNLTYKYLSRTYPRAEKPIKAVHFHLSKENLDNFKPIINPLLWNQLI